MAFPSWFSRLTSSKHIHKIFHKSQSLTHHHRSHPSLLTTLLNSNSHQNKPPFPWSTSLLPLAIAVSAASFGLDSQRNTTYCDSSEGSIIGGKDSTEVVAKGTPREVSKEFIDELKAICQDNMTLDYDDRYFHGKPQNSFHKAVNIPDVVVFPRSEEEIAKIVTTCNNYEVPIVPYGGATSVEGHTLTPSCGVCIDMALMKKVKTLRVEDMDVVVEPGIGWMELNEYLEPYGLFSHSIQNASSASSVVTLVGATSPPLFALEVFVQIEGEPRFRRLCLPFLYSHSSSNVLEVEVVGDTVGHSFVGDLILFLVEASIY